MVCFKEAEQDRQGWEDHQDVDTYPGQVWQCPV